MNRLFLIILTIFILLQLPVLAEQTGVPTSASYAISSQVFETVSVSSTSDSYTMLGKERDREIGDTSNSRVYRVNPLYKLFEGFFSTFFKIFIFDPIISGISPTTGTNDSIVTVTITGDEFLTSPATVELELGSSKITGGVVSWTNSEIVCKFDLRGKATGNWTLRVIREDGREATFDYFTILSPGLKLVGTPINYPNPFNPKTGPTEIIYTLTEDADITLYIFNILGERVQTFKFFAGQVEGGHQGENRVLWKGDSPFGGILPSGVYICQITSGGRILGTVKIAIVK